MTYDYHDGSNISEFLALRRLKWKAINESGDVLSSLQHLVKHKKLDGNDIAIIKLFIDCVKEDEYRDVDPEIKQGAIEELQKIVSAIESVRYKSR